MFVTLLFVALAVGTTGVAVGYRYLGAPPPRRPDSCGRSRIR